jgi:uncharacterized protein (TIGR02001 family)
LLRGAFERWSVACMLCVLLPAGTAVAQVSGRIALVSDYRFRGASLSDGDPALQASVAYDASGGWYAGVFASSVRIESGRSGSDRSGSTSGTQLQLQPYAGYARRIDASTSWDVGVAYAAFLGNTDYDYPELHLGISRGRFSARLYYAPEYFGISSPVYYAEVDGAFPLSPRWRLLAHVGWLHRSASGEEDYYLERHRFDGRVAFAWTLAAFDLQVAWVFSDGQAGRYPAYPGARADDQWTLSVARSW